MKVERMSRANKNRLHNRTTLKNKLPRKIELITVMATAKAMSKAHFVMPSRNRCK